MNTHDYNIIPIGDHCAISILLMLYLNIEYDITKYYGYDNIFRPNIKLFLSNFLTHLK